MKLLEPPEKVTSGSRVLSGERRLLKARGCPGKRCPLEVGIREVGTAKVEIKLRPAVVHVRLEMISHDLDQRSPDFPFSGATAVGPDHLPLVVAVGPGVLSRRRRRLGGARVI